MLSGKTALVTGGGRGIGRAIAGALAGRGARVVVTGRTEAELREVASEIGGVAIRCDLAQKDDVTALLTRLADLGRVDVLINNAGIADSAPLERTTDAVWERAMAVNVTAPFLLCRGLAPPMVAAGWGRIVNIASNAGRTGYAYTSAYCASKHALVGLTRSLALELARTGVTVNALCPGWVKTDMAQAAAENIASKTKRSVEDAETTLAAMSPQRRLMEAEEVAHMTLALLEAGARGVNGQAIPIDGGQVMA